MGFTVFHAVMCARGYLGIVGGLLGFAMATAMPTAWDDKRSWGSGVCVCVLVCVCVCLM